MPIDLKSWCARIESLVGKVLPDEVVVSSKPDEFFDGFFCDAGFPCWPDMYPIWDDRGVVIYINSAQTFVFDLDGCRWKRFCDTDCQRIFWISEDGILGEIDDGSGRVTEFFPVSSPNAAVEYIALLCGKQLERRTHGNEREMQIENIVADSYVHFFRFPDDLSPEIEQMPWVSIRKLDALIRQYILQEVAWLNPFLAEFQQLEIRKKIKGESESAKTIQVGDSGEKISKNELFLWLSGLNQGELDPLRKTCLHTAATIEEADVLDVTHAWRLQTYRLWYGFMGPRSALKIDVAVFPTDEIYPDYISKNVHPSAWQIIREQVLMPLAGKEESAAPARILLPNFAEQKRRAFEALAYRHAIDIKSRNLSDFQTGKENASELHGLLANRYSEVTTILNRMPTYDAEFERMHFPLPYFIEAPFIAWERAPNILKIQNGFMAFGNLLKQVVLLGLIEVQASKNRLTDFKPQPKDLIAGISGHPSLGHWSKCLDWLGAFAAELTIFGGWIRVLVEHRTQTILLTELRNKYAHPSCVLERAFLESIRKQLDAFFTKVLPKLRREKKVKMILPLVRRAVRQQTEISFEFIGHDLCSSYERFREVSIQLSNADSKNMVEGEIIAVGGADSPKVLSLQEFFRAKEVAADQYTILVYDKSYNGKSGVFSAVDSEVQDNLPMLNSPLQMINS